DDGSLLGRVPRQRATDNALRYHVAAAFRW
ncbi:helicase, partial [Klebsiella phage vB_Kpn-VAC111]